MEGRSASEQSGTMGKGRPSQPTSQQGQRKLVGHAAISINCGVTH